MQTITTTPSKKRQLFPPHGAKSKAQLSWDAISPPAQRSTLAPSSSEAAPSEAAKHPTQERTLAVGPHAVELPGPVKRAKLHVGTGTAAQAKHVSPLVGDGWPAESGSQAGEAGNVLRGHPPGVVDFMTADELEQDNVAASAHVPDHAYDSSDDGDGNALGAADTANEDEDDGKLSLKEMQLIDAVVAKLCAHRLGSGLGAKSGLQASQGTLLPFQPADMSAILEEFRHTDSDGASDSSVSDCDEQQWEHRITAADEVHS